MGKALQALLVAVSLIMGLASTQSMARDLTVDQKFTDFRFLVSAIQSGYGPLEYKMTNKVVDYVALNSRFEQAIRQTTSNQDFYYLMVEYVSAYRDGHFHIRVPTSRAATLPLDTDLIDGKVLILKIDRQKLSEEEFPFALGDEVISLDGRPVLEYLNEATKYITSGNEKTRLKVAAWTVFHRNGRSLPVPSAKSVTVEIRRGTSQVIESVQLDWEFKGQDAELPDPADIDPSLLTSSVRTASFNYDLLTNDLFDWYAHPSSDAAFSCSGDTRITIPSNATVIMKSPFVAYYHPTEKGNIGYLRIPHYYPRTPPGGNEVVTVLDWVEQYRAMWEERLDRLDAYLKHVAPKPTQNAPDTTVRKKQKPGRQGVRHGRQK